LNEVEIKKENPSEIFGNFNNFPFIKYHSSINNITTTNEDSINDNSKIVKKNKVGFSAPSKHPTQNFFKLNNKILKIKEKNFLSNKSDILNGSYGIKEEGEEKLQNSISYKYKEKTKKSKKESSRGFRDFYEEMKNILLVENRKVLNNTRNEAEGSSKKKKEIEEEETINLFKRKKNVKHRTAKDKIKIVQFNIKNLKENENLPENPYKEDSDFKKTKIRHRQGNNHKIIIKHDSFKFEFFEIRPPHSRQILITQIQNLLESFDLLGKIKLS
jgi:hypothetical protein